MKPGLNFPEYTVRQALGESLNFEKNCLKGLVCRWPLLELQALFERPFKLSSLLKRIYGFTSRFFYSRCNYDINLVDIEPGFSKVIEFILYSLKIVRSKLSFKCTSSNGCGQIRYEI